jgi:hypothetical protein
MTFEPSDSVNSTTGRGQKAPAPFQNKSARRPTTSRRFRASVPPVSHVIARPKLSEGRFFATITSS